MPYDVNGFFFFFFFSDVLCFCKISFFLFGEGCVAIILFLYPFGYSVVLCCHRAY